MQGLILRRKEKHYEAQGAKIKVDYLTDHGQYHAAHWHNELEMIYLLNGNAKIVLDGQSIQLVQGEFIVIDAGRIFELQCKESFMQIRVHIDKEFLAARTGNLSGSGEVLNRRYACQRGDLRHEQLEPFLQTCELFRQLVPLYINEPDGYLLKTESIVLDILYHLVQDFSEQVPGSALPEISQDQKRIRNILEYIENHYRDPVSLADISREFGLSREYFSRLFHKNIGITLSEHLIRVRIAHFYHDLVTTDDPVMELLEKNGLTNYKQFSRTFKELYGYTPRALRKIIL